MHMCTNAYVLLCMRGPSLSVIVLSILEENPMRARTTSWLQSQPDIPLPRRDVRPLRKLFQLNGRRIGHGTKHTSPHGHSPTAHCRWLKRGTATPAERCPPDAPLDATQTGARLERPDGTST